MHWYDRYEIVCRYDSGGYWLLVVRGRSQHTFQGGRIGYILIPYNIPVSSSYLRLFGIFAFFSTLHVWCSFYYNYISSICSLMVFWSPLRPSVFTSEVFKITTSARSPQKKIHWLCVTSTSSDIFLSIVLLLIDIWRRKVFDAREECQHWIFSLSKHRNCWGFFCSCLAWERVSE